jgi:hypothetical protein
MKGLARSLGRGTPQLSVVRKVVYKPKAVALTTTDGAPAWGTCVLGYLPQGNLLILGCAAYLSITKTDADIVDTWDGDFSLGSAPTADGALAGAEIDLIPSTATPQAVAGVSAAIVGVSTATIGGSVLDNTAGALEINCNLLIDDADSSGAGSATVTGVVYLAYIVLGDD